MERRDWETLILALENLGLRVERLDELNGRITVRIPNLGEKISYHLQKQ